MLILKPSLIAIHPHPCLLITEANISVLQSWIRSVPTPPPPPPSPEIIFPDPVLTFFHDKLSNLVEVMLTHGKFVIVYVQKCFLRQCCGSTLFSKRIRIQGFHDLSWKKFTAGKEFIFFFTKREHPVLLSLCGSFLPSCIPNADPDPDPAD